MDYMCEKGEPCARGIIEYYESHTQRREGPAPNQMGILYGIIVPKRDKQLTPYIFKTIDPKVRKEPGASGRFAIFSSPVLGAKALIQKKIIKWANGNMPATSANQTMKPKYATGSKPTIKQFITTYAPPTENNTAGYIAKVVNGVKSIKPNTTANTLVASIIS
jgi:hypothetical protein